MIAEVENSAYLCLMDNETKSAPNIRLLADRLLVRLDDAKEEKTVSGIIIPVSVKSDTEHGAIGTVLGISSQVADHNKKKPKERVEIGSRIMFSHYAGSKISYQNNNYVVMRITDLFGVIEGE